MSETYLDNNATTPVAPEVIEAMRPFFDERFGNPSSLHRKGVEAERAVTDARHTLADMLGVSEREVIFTSGATEAVNMAIRGLAERNPRMGRHIVTTAVEHDCVLSSCQALEEKGYEVSYLKTDEYGAVTPEAVVDAIRDDTVLVAVMHVNNELGTINPVEEIARAVKGTQKQPYMIVDGVQAFGKLIVDLSHIDGYAVSAHKIHGPKGVGALVLKEAAQQRTLPLIVGGGQEFGMRSGTQNVPAIVGFAKAAERAHSGRGEHREHMDMLRNMLRNYVEEVADVVINSPNDALATTFNVAFLGVPAETLLHALEENGIYVSTGSACSSNNQIKSHVLEHVSGRQEVIDSSIRFGLSRMNTREEIERVGEVLKEKVEELRRTLPRK